MNTPISQNSRPQDTYNGVQALRFIAALMVVITHSTFYAKERLDPNAPFWPYGASGVSLFFVISGFVMVVSSRSLVGTHEGWKIFALKRIVRIVPMYWIATSLKVLALVFAGSAVRHASLNPINILCSYLFLPTTNAEGNIEPLLGVGWTLVFEMFFYTTFAIALMSRRIDYFYPVGSVLAICAFGSLFRTISWPAIRFYFDPIVLAFLFGMIIGRTISLHRAAPASVGILAVVLGFSLLLTPDAYLRHLSLVNLAAAALVVWGAVNLEPRYGKYVPKPILFLGAASYTIYLFHPMIAPAVPELLSRLQMKTAAISVVGSIVVAISACSVIYFFVEKRLTSALGRLVPRGRARTLDGRVSRHESLPS